MLLLFKPAPRFRLPSEFPSDRSWFRIDSGSKWDDIWLLEGG